MWCETCLLSHSFFFPPLLTSSLCFRSTCKEMKWNCILYQNGGNFFFLLQSWKIFPPHYLYFWALPSWSQPVDYKNITAFPLFILDKLQPPTRTAIADSRRLVLNCLLFLKSWKQGHDSSYSVEIENAQAQCTQGNCNLTLSLSLLPPFIYCDPSLHCSLQSSQGAETGWGRNCTPAPPTLL